MLNFHSVMVEWIVSSQKGAIILVATHLEGYYGGGVFSRSQLLLFIYSMNSIFVHLL